MFAGKKFALLYRGSRDGFGSKDFHGCCDQHGNTMTLILSENESIFGRFTPLVWSSRGDYVPDPTLQSFVFTIKNPHNLPARIFGQKEASSVIHDHRQYGPSFGSNRDIRIYNQCRTTQSNYSSLGGTFNIDSGMDGSTVLTGAYNFSVKEIEVFEVIGFS
jgi:hypothetical protein